MSGILDAEAIVHQINQDFVNKMQLAANMIVNYDADTLSLLSKADYKQRKAIITVLFGVMQRATQRQIKIAFDIKDCDGYIKYYRPTKSNKNADKNEHDIWSGLRAGSLRLQSRNDAILVQVKAGLALFRGSGIFDAFEAYEDAISDVLGLEEDGVKGAKVAATKAQEEQAKPENKSMLKKVTDKIAEVAGD